MAKETPTLFIWAWGLVRRVRGGAPKRDEEAQEAPEEMSEEVSKSNSCAVLC